MKMMMRIDYYCHALNEEVANIIEEVVLIDKGKVLLQENVKPF